MSRARWQHIFLQSLFGGKDMTLFHLKRLDESDGRETLDDIKQGRLTPAQRRYLNEYLHEYGQEYVYVGRYMYD
jgi:sulfite reductase (NADPH) flavoprotein alpha-component